MDRTNIGQNQHLIPQFYLRRFRSKTGKNLIFRFDKQTGLTERVHLKQVASAFDYYVAPDAEGRPRSLENELSQVESYFSEALMAVTGNPSAEVLAAHKSEMADFLACQAHRTEVIRDRVRKLATSDLGETRGVPSDDDIKRMHLAVIATQTQALSQELCDLKWMLLHNNTSTPFCPLWLGDYPFCTVSEEGQLDFAVFVPLSPRLLLVMENPERNAQRPNGIEINRSWVELINSMLINESWRYLYSPTDDFSLAQQILRDHPSVASLDRERLPRLHIEPK